MLNQSQIFRYLSQESSKTDTDASTILPDFTFENKNRLMSVIGELVGHRGQVTSLATPSKSIDSSQQFLISSALDMVNEFNLISYHTTNILSKSF